MHFLRIIIVANYSEILINSLCDVNLMYVNIFRWTRRALECKRCTNL